MNFYIKQTTICNTKVADGNDSITSTTMHSLCSSKTKVYKLLKQLYGPQFKTSYSNLCKHLNRLSYSIDMLRFVGSQTHEQDNPDIVEQVIQRQLLTVEIVQLPHCNIGQEEPIVTHFSVD